MVDELGKPLPKPPLPNPVIEYIKEQNAKYMITASMPSKPRKDANQHAHASQVKSFTPPQMKSIMNVFFRCTARSAKASLNASVSLQMFVDVLKQAKTLDPFMATVEKLLLGSLSPDLLQSSWKFHDIIGFCFPNHPSERIQKMIDAAEPEAPTKAGAAFGKVQGIRGKLLAGRAVSKLFNADISRNVGGSTIQQPITMNQTLEMLKIFNQIGDGRDLITKKEFLGYFGDALSMNLSQSQQLLSRVWQHVLWKNDNTCNFKTFCEIILPHGYVMVEPPKTTKSSTDLYNIFFEDAALVKTSGPYQDIFGKETATEAGKSVSKTSAATANNAREAFGASQVAKSLNPADEGMKILAFIDATVPLPVSTKKSLPPSTAQKKEGK